MPSTCSIVGALVIGCASLLLPACDNSNSGTASTAGATSSGSGGGITGVYTSVESDEIKIEFKSGGTVVMSMGDEQGPPGTYTIDGEKVLVTVDGQTTTFIRDGDCLEDAQRLFGKMCKGGKAGAAANVSTRTPPPTTGIWVATNADGEFTLVFSPEKKVSLSAKLADRTPDPMEGTYTIEGDTLYCNLTNGMPMVLKWVNGAYESTAFGLPMKFVKQ